MEQIEEGSTEWMRLNPPPMEEGNDPEEYWPVDEYGLKIPMREWTVGDLGRFPDSMKDWLARELRKVYGTETPAERLLREMPPSEIARYPRMANARLGEIAQEMGIRAEYRT